MRFPLPLSMQMMKARISRRGSEARDRTLFHHVDASEVLHAGSSHPVSHEKIQEIVGSACRFVWIGGIEPLGHPGVGHLVRAITRTGHFVFVETDGTLLRRRIHEFQALPQIVFVVRLETETARGNSESAWRGTNELAIEGIRAAQLSGFYTAAESTIGEDSDLAELNRVSEFLRKFEVDGWLMLAANAGAMQKTKQARALIPSAGWRRLSERIEGEFLPRVRSADRGKAMATPVTPEERYEEGVSAS